MNRILVINVNWMGDVIFSVPVFKALKKTYPGAHISCLAVPRVREILECNSYVDEIITYDEEGTHQSPFAKIKLISQLRGRKFDVAFLLHRSFTRALLVFWAGIPERIGYATKGRGILLTHKVKPKPGLIHRSDQYLHIIESYGVKVEDRNCDLKVVPELREEMDGILLDHGIGPGDFLIVAHFAGNWDLKRWSKENFAKLIDRLISEFNAKVVLPGGANEIGLAREIAALTVRKPVILAGQTNLKNLAALLRRANVVISADSGPLHLASSVGANVIGLFGPTRPEVTAPRGTGRCTVLQHDVGCNREPCYNLDCPDNICMRSIKVEEVMHAVQSFRN